MNALKVSTRLALTTGVLVLLLALVGAMGLFGLSATNQSLKTVYDDRVVPMGQLSHLQQLHADVQDALHEAVSKQDSAAVQQAVALEAQRRKEHATIWTAYRATFLTPEEKVLASALEAAEATYRRDGVDPLTGALQASDWGGAKALMNGAVALHSQALSKGSEKLVQLQIEVAAQEYASANARFDTLLAATLAVVLAGVATAAGLGWALSRGLMRQLGAEPADAAALAHAVAAGGLDTRITLRAGDHTSLMAALVQMRDSLSRTVTAVRRDADGVANASSEIAQGTQDLSQRTEEQASALQQTAASMEQVGSTARQNAEQAREARRLAEDAAQVARRGGAVVSDVVGTMQGIEQSSRRIAEIVSTIDGIAFQTNILALNAAVEAARAGEQGRGFAVVASEVRNLAQRSAAAAREVKTLIAESAERVDAGARRVSEAGQTMQEIETTVTQLHTIVAEISSASAEQSAGVQQIGEAVSQMDQTTQQNAALVEQSSAAAESLRQQAAQLLEAVSVFRLRQAEPA
jgi:methyl-accepting chemotaxis protein-1 (serine sensor receptor)